ncbi:CRISPR-associated protein Cas4 [Spirulina subsalsa FACHB-351]|uniref:CRISPR-associated exonuclease Cas4 n=1 Tax=Spirulina subsalsa FACHB-351 TaxID=234711 RepID=A0ABT3L2C0_9CYAN|nr:CRISPR-associated protein Cas4 [Spirulina subsalsa]MCW6035625.1 CRISPR-associated protein Cas4 [Spirulina subsalsa FACHB-351]
MNLTDEYIPIAALNQYDYCPHRYWRMFEAGEFTDNEYTIEGTSLHDRVHQFGTTNQGEIWQIRSIWLKSEQYQVIGKADLIEAEGGKFYPIEYKRGKKGEWGNDALQVCAQALCLEEMTGQEIALGYLYYAQSHQRQGVEISRELREEAIAILQKIRQISQTGEIPKPNYSKRCKGCSLSQNCLPQATKKVNTYHEEP